MPQERDTAPERKRRRRRRERGNASVFRQCALSSRFGKHFAADLSRSEACRHLASSEFGNSSGPTGNHDRCCSLAGRDGHLLAVQCHEGRPCWQGMPDSIHPSRLYLLCTCRCDCARGLVSLTWVASRFSSTVPIASPESSRRKVTFLRSTTSPGPCMCFPFCLCSLESTRIYQA